jgi:2'-5' RNA ligase
LKLRLFVALDLPEPARAALAAFRSEMADPAVWRPVPDEALHLTLAFLGHRPEADVERIAGILQGAPVNAPRLSRELAAARLYEPAEREFRPHATVARLRPDARVAGGKMPGPAPVTFYGEALTLYRSQLRREGARYEPLARLPLREWSSQAPGEAGPV